jgi:hypothetical protein
LSEADLRYLERDAVGEQFVYGGVGGGGVVAVGDVGAMALGIDVVEVLACEIGEGFTDGCVDGAASVWGVG